MEIVHEGTTATGPGTRARSMPTFIKAAVIVAFLSMLLVAASLLAGSLEGSGEAARLSSDTSTQQVEALRGAAVLPAGSVDDSYDRVEHIRAVGPTD